MSYSRSVIRTQNTSHFNSTIIFSVLLCSNKTQSQISYSNSSIQVHSLLHVYKCIFVLIAILHKCVQCVCVLLYVVSSRSCINPSYNFHITVNKRHGNHGGKCDLFWKILINSSDLNQQQKWMQISRHLRRQQQIKI